MEPVYDECNSSVIDEDAVERGVCLDPKTWSNKKQMLLELCAKSQPLIGLPVKNPFASVKRKDVKANRIDFLFMTRYGASLNVSLLRYSSGKCYLSTRGSPTKVLSGQNLVPLQEATKEAKVISDCRKRLNCTDFEAKSVQGFIMVDECIRKNLGIREFFTPVEMNALDCLDISVYSLTFATHPEFGRNKEERDRNLRLLSCLVNTNVQEGGIHYPLMSFLRVSGTTVKTIQDLNYHDPDLEVVAEDSEETKRYGSCLMQGPNATVMLTKSKSDGKLLTKQVMYLKEEEMFAKRGNSGCKNYELYSSMSPEEKSRIDRQVRIDNTFGKEYLKEWMHALTGREYKDVTIRDVDPLCDSPQHIRAMAFQASNDLGLRTLLVSPTIAGIRKIEANVNGFMSELEEEIFGEWLDEGIHAEEVMVGKKSKAVKLTWRKITSGNVTAWRLNNKLMERYRLDISLPFAFYQKLNAARANFFLVGNQDSALDADRNNDTGRGSRHETVANIKASTVEEARRMVLDIRKVINIPMHKTKEQILLDPQHS